MKRWIVTLEDAGDGSGDLLLPLSDEMLAEADLQMGDALDCVVVGDKIVLTKRSNT